jgi:hypothetical protein
VFSEGVVFEIDEETLMSAMAVEELGFAFN